MITPLRDRVLVRLLPLNAPAEGLVSVVRLERQPTTYAEVVAVGEDIVEVAVGARVVISRLQGIEVGDDMLMLPESAVLAHAEA